MNKHFKRKKNTNENKTSVDYQQVCACVYMCNTSQQTTACVCVFGQHTRILHYTEKVAVWLKCACIV